VRFYNATPDVTIEGRLSRYGSDIMNRRAWEQSASYLDWARKPITTGPYKVVELKPDVSLTLEAHDEYWGGRPPLKRIRFPRSARGREPHQRLLSGEYQFACDIPPDQIAGIEKNAAFEVQGGTILNHRLTVFDKNHAVLANPLVRRAFTTRSTRQAIVDSLWAGPTRVPKGLQWNSTVTMFNADWSVPAYDPKLAQDLLKQANYKGDPFPIACSTTTTPTRWRPRRSWSRCGSRSASTSRSRPRRTGPRSWSVSERAACATGRTPRRSTIRSPRSSRSTGRTDSSSRSANGPTPN
jgi:peptide/nickel transport system substrate-binding protein